MWTGRQTLRSIEDAIGKLHGQERGLDATLHQLSAEAERLRSERGDALRQLARVKLGEMAAGRLTQELDSAERRASALLVSRRDRLSRMTQTREGALAAFERAQAARDEAAQRVEDALSALEGLHGDVQDGIRTKDDWLAADEAVTRAIAVAEEAERKAALNATELAEKKKPYDEDPLFRYLWDRGFGTPAYRAGNLTRMIDRWVAALIGYMDQRANYHMLGEIPLRLAEHAKARRDAVADAEGQRAAIERSALLDAGLEDREKALAAARAALADAETALEAARKDVDGADAARDALLSGAGDPEFLSAIASIATGDAQDDSATLWREARRTATPEDDGIVQRIEDIDAKLAATARELEKTREAARELATRRTEVEQAREKFRQAGYDHPHAGFGNERIIMDVLGGILSGALKGGSLWDILRDGYAQRAPRGRPDFGGGFPFPIPRRSGRERDDDDDDDDDDDRPKRRSRDRVRGGDWRIPTTGGGWAPDWSGGPSRSGGPFRDSGGADRNDSDDFITGGRF